MSFVSVVVLGQPQHPWTGDIANLPAVPLANGPVPPQFGQTGDYGPFGVRPTYDGRFDLTNYNVQISSGQLFTIGIEAVSAGGSISGLLTVVESNEAGPSDRMFGSSLAPDYWEYVVDLGAPFLDFGRFGYAISAVSLSGVADGDINADDSVDGRDITGFAVALIAAETQPPARCHADFSGNGVVDTADLPGFVTALLAS